MNSRDWLPWDPIWSCPDPDTYRSLFFDSVFEPVAMSPQLELTTSRQFPNWLAEQQISLAFSTYQAGKLFTIGLQPTGRLSIFERTFSRCMGLWADGQTIWMTSLYQLWRLENVLEPGQQHDGYDRVYVPQVRWPSQNLCARQTNT